MTSPFALMQMAVDIVGTSPHPTNKIAATLTGHDLDGNPFTISKTNCWPDAIEKAFGRSTDIGNSSGTIHAETACILQAPRTHDSTLFITDPPCPNCAKNIAEAGIRHLYIDHKGFEKDFAQRRGEDIRSMSLRILEAAGISVYKIFRKEQQIIPVIDIAAGYNPPQDDPLFCKEMVSPASLPLLRQSIGNAATAYNNQPFAVCLAEKQGQLCLLAASTHPTIGFTHEDDLSGAGKYSFVLEPLNHLIMAAKNHGFTILPDYIYSSRVPTAREMVNLIGLGINTLNVGDDQSARDQGALEAKALLEKNHILEFLRITPA